MSKDNKTITLRELPELNKISDNDIFLITDGNKTHKVTGKSLIQYMKSHDDIADYFVHQDTVGSANGVAPLDCNKKILSENIPFGSQTGSVYEGAFGKALENTVGTKADKKELDSHVTDQASHITSTERTAWNDSNAKKHTHSNKTALDGITAPLITDWNKAAAHISDSEKHITDKERALWNTVNDKVTKVDGKALSSNDFSNAEKAKLQGIASGANLYRHPDADGSRHIPANGTTNGGKYLKATSTAGSYKWENLTKADVESALGYTPSGSESVTYALSKSGSNIILTGSDGSKTSIPDSDTTYTLSDFGITSSSSEINQLKGVKSNVQTQLNNVYTKNEANTLLNDKLAKAGDGSNLTAAFTEAPALTTINTGEKLSVIMGKVKKAITALLSHTDTTATASVSGHVKVDSALNSASINPVQNKTVNAALAGKLSTAGDASSTTVAYNEAAALTELASGEKQSVAFGKLKLAVKNVMSIVKLLGSTDISAIGGGTVTGALAAINSNLKADHWLPAPGYDLLAAATSKAIQIYSANPNILAAQGVPKQFSQYGTYVCYGKCEYPTLMYIDVFGRFGAYGRETKQWENYSALEIFGITPVTGINAGMSLKVKNGILYSKVWVTLPNMSEWSSCAICTVSGWTYGNIELGQIHSVYGVNSSNVNVVISTDGIVSVHTHAAVSGGMWFYGSNAVCL